MENCNFPRSAPFLGNILSRQVFARWLAGRPWVKGTFCARTLPSLRSPFEGASERGREERPPNLLDHLRRVAAAACLAPARSPTPAGVSRSVRAPLRRTLRGRLCWEGGPSEAGFRSAQKKNRMVVAFCAVCLPLQRKIKRTSVRLFSSFLGRKLAFDTTANGQDGMRFFHPHEWLPPQK